MFRSLIIALALGGAVLAQPAPDPFQPLNLQASNGVLDRAGARRDWVKITNERMVTSNRTTRVEVEGADGLTLVVRIKDLKRYGDAKPLFKGKDDYAGILKAAQAYGFNRLVARNFDDPRKQWAARLEQNKVIVED